MRPSILVDAMNGSKITGGYLSDCSRVGHSVIFHVTVNNLRRVIPDPTLRDALVDLEGHLQLLEREEAHACLLASRADWTRWQSGSRVGIVLGYQNSGFIDDQFDLVDLLARLGVRILQITHNGPNSYGGGCAVPGPEAGITELGEEFVRRANDAGVLIDCSHASDRLTLDVCSISRRPVLLTHTNPAALAPHRRNRSDAALSAVVASGGVVGTTFYPTLATVDGHCSVDAMVQHVRYLVDLLGAESVGFGSDFTTDQVRTGDRFDALRGDGVNVLPPGDSVEYPVDGIAGIPGFLDTLACAGMPAEAIAGFAGGNFARVLFENERWREACR